MAWSPAGLFSDCHRKGLITGPEATVKLEGTAKSPVANTGAIGHGASISRKRDVAAALEAAMRAAVVGTTFKVQEPTKKKARK